ncbi:unnamed protein product [Angiostrongylus costaricensis]|uniref:Uncharacterized protein n=1 Tax=Angiostrongylus costaricensis TaxID=334426 RepID=A0A0R3PKJ9_ANGCS|nr:unnamed protein product [Angiostrongylus costaricensis]
MKPETKKMNASFADEVAYQEAISFWTGVQMVGLRGLRLACELRQRARRRCPNSLCCTTQERDHLRIWEGEKVAEENLEAECSVWTGFVGLLLPQ